MNAARRLAFVAGFAVVALAASATAASAWVCRADSRSAFGWGSSVNRGSAKAIALSQCAVRTPRGRYCRISWCR